MMVEPASPVEEGNRVLESIAQREALRALLAFSDLHEQIRNRRLSPAGCSDKDLFETERFILDEVLQLICDRVQVLTQADGIVIALAEKSTADGSKLEQPGMVTRASSGPLTVDRGVHLIGDSEFLQDCLESGRILRCDDCEIDARAELDFSRAIGARSTVLVPLHGWREQLGVLQAFSTTAWAFTDNDIRSFDLFAELVLSALKPEDEDRRIHWLSGVAENILQTKPQAAEAVAPVPKEVVPPPPAEVVAPAPTGVATPALLESSAEGEPPKAIEEPPVPAVLASTAAPAAPEEVALPTPPAPDPLSHDLTSLSGPISIPVPTVELSEAVLDLPVELDNAFEFEELPAPVSTARVLSFPERISISTSARPGLSVVIGLIAVAALFSAGLWWGMQMHGKATPKAVASATESAPQPVTAPSVPAANVLSISAPDNLMSPSKLGSEDAQLTPVPEDKLAALPEDHRRAALVIVDGQHGRHRHGGQRSLRSPSFDVAGANLLRSARHGVCRRSWTARRWTSATPR